MKLTEYLIRSADGDAYRSGRLKGMRHPAVDSRMIREVGGRRVLVEEAKKLEKAGLVRVEWKDMGADIKCFDHSVSTGLRRSKTPSGDGSSASPSLLAEVLRKMKKNPENA